MRFYLLSIILLSVAGCGKTTTTREGLLNYILDPKNGLLQKEEKNGCTIEVLYWPSDLIVYQEIKGQSLATYQIDSVSKSYQDLKYFLLRLSRNGKEITIPYASDPVKFNQANDYLGFGIGKDVYLMQVGDTTHVKDFIHTRTFGSSPSSDVLLAFSTRLEKRDQLKFVFDDKVFGLGLNEFMFDINDIKATPTLDLTKN